MNAITNDTTRTQIDEAAELHAEMIEKHGDAWQVYVDDVGAEHASEDDFVERFCGEYDSEREFAEELIDGTGMLDGVPEHVARYFDFDAFARDLFISDYFMVDTYVFRRY